MNFLYFAGGVAALAVAAFLCWALYRLGRALRALEGTLMMTEVAIQEVVPEVRESLGNVNDITAGVNVALHVAGESAGGLRRSAREGRVRAAAGLYGVRVAAGSLWRNLNHRDGGQPDGNGE